MSPGGRWIKADVKVWWSFPTLITFLLCRSPVWPSRQRDRQRFLDVGFLIGRVLTLVFCLLVWTVFLSPYQHQRLDHYPQTLKGSGTERSSNISDITQLKKMDRWCWNYTEAVLYTISSNLSCNNTHQLHSCEVDECTAWDSKSTFYEIFSEYMLMRFPKCIVVYDYMNCYNLLLLIKKPQNSWH